MYDVFAAKPGAMLLSQLTWLLGNVSDGDGAPTKPQQELHAELTKRLAGLVADFAKLTTDDLAKLNKDAENAGLPTLFLPPPKAKKEEAKPAGK